MRAPRAADDIEVFPEYTIIGNEHKRGYRADFLLQQGEEKLIIEIKNPIHGVARILSGGTEQLLDYLVASGVTNGILYIPPMRKEETLEISTLTNDMGGEVYTILQIYPKKRLNKANSTDAKSRAAD